MSENRHEKQTRGRGRAAIASLSVLLAAVTGHGQNAEAQSSLNIPEIVRLCKAPSENPFFEAYYRIAAGESVSVNGELETLQTIGDLELVHLAARLDGCSFRLPNNSAIQEASERTLFELGARNVAYSASVDAQGNVNERNYLRAYSNYYAQAGRTLQNSEGSR